MAKLVLLWAIFIDFLIAFDTASWVAIRRHRDSPSLYALINVKFGK